MEDEGREGEALAKAIEPSIASYDQSKTDGLSSHSRRIEISPAKIRAGAYFHKFFTA